MVSNFDPDFAPKGLDQSFFDHRFSHYFFPPDLQYKSKVPFSQSLIARWFGGLDEAVWRG
jgi:hypothetical protein